MIWFSELLSVLRPFFVVVKEGRILHLVSGYRKFVANDRIIQEVAGSIPVPSSFGLTSILGVLKK
jgi:hypothetical protein